MGLLLNEVFDPVTLLEYDVPRLAVKELFKKFIPILGPLGAEFNLDLGAGIDIKVGYDTFGFEFRESEKGFFFSTPRITLADGVTPAPFDDTTNPHGFAPAGSVHTTIGAAAAVRAVVLNASVGVDITYDLRAFFENDESPPRATASCGSRASTVGSIRSRARPPPTPPWRSKSASTPSRGASASRSPASCWRISRCSMSAAVR